MPPKRKGGATGGAGGKKAKAPSTVKEAVSSLKAADKGKAKRAVPDNYCPVAYMTEVYHDGEAYLDCMLNQTNIGQNNNKFYIIQVLESEAGGYYAWNRWGRVGAPGQNSLKGPFNNSGEAVKDFLKKFKDKTKNEWKNRTNFKPVPGKYTLQEMEDAEEEKEEDSAAKMAAQDERESVERETQPCKLDKATADLIKLIFDEDMFKVSMAKLQLDLKKMPLGKLSKTQIAKGFEVLEELEAAIKGGKKRQYEKLTSRFYTLIPHNFGRLRPPVISDQETIRKKMDMLSVLADIELALDMQKSKGQGSGKKGKASKLKVAHPLDEKFRLLQCNLELVDKKSREYKVIETYMRQTVIPDNDFYYGLILNLKDIWKVNRHSEDQRFAAHKTIRNHKLFWHGTHAAAVAAILKNGLRIMPQRKPGCLGRGIYFASQFDSAAENVSEAVIDDGRGGTEQIGIVFLNEVALGKEYINTWEDRTLMSAPPGYDSVVGRGLWEPDPKKDTTLTIDGNKVMVPQGEPVDLPEYYDSYFDRSEYVVYKESQNHIRYLLKIDWRDCC